MEHLELRMKGQYYFQFVISTTVVFENIYFNYRKNNKLILLPNNLTLVESIAKAIRRPIEVKFARGEKPVWGRCCLLVVLWNVVYGSWGRSGPEGIGILSLIIGIVLWLWLSWWVVVSWLTGLVARAIVFFSVLSIIVLR